MSELNDLISGLNNLQKNASSKQNTDDGLNFSFGDEPASPKAAGLPSIKSPAKAGIGLPIPKSTSALPTPKKADPAPNPDEVDVKGTVFGLPVPKFDKSMTANAGLPSPKVNVGLPAPKPSLLPTPKSNAPKAEAEQPAPKAEPVGLPSPKINTGLPSPKINTGLPSPKINAGLPAPKPEAELPEPKEFASPASDDSINFNIPNLEIDDNQDISEADFNWQEEVGSDIPCEPINLFDEAEQSATSLPKERSNFEDSALGIVKPNTNLQAPVLKLDREQPTGAFNQGHDLDNDSGLPLLDDPLNLVAKASALNADPLNLAGTPMPSQPAPFSFPPKLEIKQAADPLNLIDTSTPQRPVEPVAQPAENNDILNLFGNADPFKAAELDTQASEPQSSQASTPKKPIEPAIPLLQVPTLTKETISSEPEDPTKPAPKETVQPESSMRGKGEIEEIKSESGDADGELVFELNSIKSDKSAAKKKGGSETQNAKGSSKRNVIIAAVVLFLVVALGVAAFSNYVYQGTHVSDEELAAIPETEKVDIDWNLVKYDRQNGYITFYKNAREKLKDNVLTPQERSDTQGKILVAVTLAHTRFDQVFTEDELKVIDGSIATIAENCNSSWCALGLWSWGMLRGNDGHKIKFEPKISKDDKTIKNIIELAVNYANWKPEEEGYTAMKKHGEDILRKVSDSALEWPLTAWIVASTHRRLGQFKDATQILETMHSDDDTKFSSGALLLEAEIQLAMDNIENAIKLAETVQNHKYSDQEDKVRAEQLLFMAKSTTLNDKDFDNALTEYINKNLKNPQNIENAVQACLYSNRIELCKKTISIIQERNPKNISVLDAYTSILLDKLGYVMLVRPDSGCPKVILHTVDKLINDGIELNPKNPTTWRHRALVSYAMRDYENTENALLEVERGETMIWLGSFLRELMQYQEAEKSEDKAKMDAIREKLKGYAKDVFQAEDAVTLAIALDYVGEQKSAATLIARAAQLHPEQTPILKSYFELAIALRDKASADKTAKQLEARHALSYEYEYQYAKLIEETGDRDSALEKMLVLIEKSKDSLESKYISYVGELFFKQEQCDSAMPYFVQALEVSGGNDAVAHYYKGRCLYNEKKFSEALNEFSEAGSQDDGNHFYKLWSGLTYIGMNRNQEAQKSFSNIIDEYQIKMDKKVSDYTLTESDKDVLADAFFYRAEVRKLQNRKADTKDDYLEALNFRPEDLRYLKGYAVFLYENEKTKESIEYINKAETLGNGELDPVLYYVRGLSKLRLNDRKEALVEFEKALNNGFADLPDSGIIGVRETAEVYERLGYLYRDLGRKEDARNALQKFLEKSQVLSNSARKDVQSDIDKI